MPTPPSGHERSSGSPNAIPNAAARLAAAAAPAAAPPGRLGSARRGRARRRRRAGMAHRLRRPRLVRRHRREAGDSRTRPVRTSPSRAARRGARPGRRSPIGSTTTGSSSTPRSTPPRTGVPMSAGTAMLRRCGRDRRADARDLVGQPAAAATRRSSTSCGASASWSSRGSCACRATTHEARQWLLVAMVTVWGLRLAGYLFWRNHGKPRGLPLPGDAQALGTPVPARQPRHRVRVAGRADVGRLAAGAARSGPPTARPRRARLARRRACGRSGCSSRSVGDAQLARFKADPANAGSGDGPRAVALHPPPQLLRRRLRVVGHRAGRRRDRRRRWGCIGARGDDRPAAARCRA